MAKYDNNNFHFIGKAGYSRTTPVYEKMDSLKICNTELPHGKESLVHALLDSKLHNTSVSTEENSNCEKTSRTRKAIVPNYCFKIVNYSIGENVEYEVELV